MQSRISRESYRWFRKAIMFSILINILNLGVVNMMWGQNQNYIEDDLDEWCANNFNDCYGGRTYQSISVSDYSIRSYSDEVEIVGYVSYLNFLDIESRVPFKVTIRIRSNGRLAYEMKKEDSVDSSYETCERTYNSYTPYFSYIRRFL